MTRLKRTIFSIFGMALLATGFVACSSDDANSSSTTSNESMTTSSVYSQTNDWEQYITRSESATEENSIIFNSHEEYIDFVSKLNEDINNSELKNDVPLKYKGRVLAARGCADGMYHGSAMSSGFATLGFDVTVSGGCITGVSGAFSGMTMGISYSQGGTSIGCNSASVCGNVNYNLFLEGIGTVYSRRVCYSISLSC